MGVEWVKVTKGLVTLELRSARILLLAFFEGSEVPVMMPTTRTGGSQRKVMTGFISFPDPKTLPGFYY